MSSSSLSAGLTLASIGDDARADRRTLLSLPLLSLSVLSPRLRKNQLTKVIDRLILMASGASAGKGEDLRDVASLGWCSFLQIDQSIVTDLEPISYQH